MPCTGTVLRILESDPKSERVAHDSYKAQLHYHKTASFEQRLPMEKNHAKEELEPAWATPCLQCASAYLTLVAILY